MRTFLPGVTAALVLFVAEPRAALAEGGGGGGGGGGEELRTLLGQLDRHAEQFEQMKQRGAYTIGGEIDELDSDGKVEGHRSSVVRVAATARGPVTEIVSYRENGKDTTADAREKAEKAKKEKNKKRPEFHLPFLASEQPRYLFAITDHDAANPRRVRVTFAPRTAAEDAYKGSAWVDTQAGEVLTMGFSPTKNGTFVDHVDVTVRFETPTALGRAPSVIEFDARGSFLFVKRHYRGRVLITDTRVVL